MDLVTGKFLSYKHRISNNNENLLYFTQTFSDNMQCTKPLDKTFKCTIYKNGVPLN